MLALYFYKDQTVILLPTVSWLARSLQSLTRLEN